MRVAIHTDQLWFAAPGGIGTYIRELLAALATLEEAPEVVTFQMAEREPGGPVPDVEVPGSIGSRYPSWALAGRPKLPEVLRACDVVHATNHAAVPPAAPGQGLVVTVHDLAFDVVPGAFPARWRLQYRAGVRAAIRRARMVLVPSASTASDLQERYGIEAARLRVTPLAASLPPGDVDPGPALAELGIDGPYVLAAGTLEPRKGVVTLIRAYRQAAPELEHTLVLAGPDGTDTERVLAELDRGGPGRIVLTGRLDGPALDAVIRGASLLAYPSRYEGFGLPILEAMQRGVPVITTTTPACAETAGDAAVLVEPGDVAGLADALVRVLGDTTLRTDLASRGRLRARGYSWTATARATLDAYRDAAATAR
jgi:glycosyltransferase involved in cell wall biosynthesis